MKFISSVTGKVCPMRAATELEHWSPQIVTYMILNAGISITFDVGACVSQSKASKRIGGHQEGLSPGLSENQATLVGGEKQI